MGKIIIFAAISLLAVCSAANRRWFQSRIVGGSETTIEQHPYQVAILIDNHPKGGGSIINKNWILTAAHVTEAANDIADRLSIRAGSTIRSTGGTVIQVKRVSVHPRRRGVDRYKQNYDYALLELQQDLSYSDGIQPIALAQSEVPDGTTCMVSGWGDTEDIFGNGDDENQEILHAVTLATYNREECNEIYYDYGGAPLNVTKHMICAYAEGKDACEGDSGGPLTIETDGERQLLGIVSFSRGCGVPNQPGVYASVPAALDWISETTNGNIISDISSAITNGIGILDPRK